MKRDSAAMKRRTKAFALRILKLYRSLPKTDEGRVLGRQVLRSGTSIGANDCAACRGRSRAEFAAKLGIVLEEADETVFWLELIREAAIFPETKLRDLCQEANELVSIFCHFRPHREGFNLCNLTSGLDFTLPARSQTASSIPRGQR